jgi:ubiquinone/menaquinone biosynthesis C-methylase UbiE
MNWWEKTPAILSGDYEKVYGITDEITQLEVDFLINECGLQPQSQILDLCCGTGRHALQLAKLGYAITGQDISADFLRIAEEKSAQSGLSIEWVNRDMRDIPFEDKFDLVFIMFGAWGYFEEDHENQAVFKAIHRALKANGHFILDFFNRDWILRHFQPERWAEREMGHYLERRQFDVQAGRLKTESVFIYRDGSTVQWETSTRAYTLQEIENMLQRTGFSIMNVYGSLDKQPYNLNTPRMLLHAQKGSG